MNVKQYVDRVSSSPIGVPFEAVTEDEMSIRGLLILAKKHELLKRYVGSIHRIPPLIAEQHICA